MKRKTSSGTDSLDLLLDTICNTFGGVLFISMLVVILLNISSENVSTEQVPQKSHREMLEAQSMLAESSLELQMLRAAAQQRKSISEKFANPNIADQIRQLKQLELVNATTAASRDKMLDDLVTSQSVINDTVKQMHELQTAEQALKEELSNVETELQQEIAQRTRTARLPKQHRTSKQQIAFLMKNGKLYSFARMENGVLTQNDSEVKIRTEGNLEIAEPIDSAGLAVAPETEDLSQIESRLNQFRAEDHFVAIFVWPDSFSHFAPVKEALLHNKFEYQLVPWSGDRDLYVGTTSEEVNVQGGG